MATDIKPDFYKRVYQNYLKRGRDDRDRLVESRKFFSGIKHGQWNDSAVVQLTNEGRPITSFNFIQNKVLTMAGSFLVNGYETKFSSEVGQSADQANLMEELYLYDRDRCGLKIERAQFLLEFLINTGAIEIYKDYRHSPFGNVSFRARDMIDIITDPDWQTRNVNDNKKIFIHSMKDAEEVVQTWGFKNKAVREAYDRIQAMIDDPSDRTAEIDKIADRSPEFYDSIGHKYKVIDCMEMKYVKKAQLYNVKTGEWLMPMDEDVARSMMRLDSNRMNLRLLPREYKECWHYIICPALGRDLVLENGPDPLQIERYPFFFSSALNNHGERQGIVEPLKDPQATYNKRESTMTYWQMTSANGAEFIEEGAFESEEEYQRYKREGNKPGTKFKVADGANSQKKIMIKDRGTPPSDLWTSADRALNMSDRMFSPPVTSGLEGKSGESGKLFNEKKQQALVALQYMEEELMDIERQMGEAYFLAAKQVYSGPYREVKNSKTNKVIRLNLPTAAGTVNDLSKITRMGVTILQSPESETVKQDRLNIYSQTRALMTSPIAQAAMDAKIFENLPGLSNADKAEVLPLLQKNMLLLSKRMDQELKQYEQADAQGGAPPGAGAPTGPFQPDQSPQAGGGNSVEGKPIKPGSGLPVDVKAQNQLA